MMMIMGHRGAAALEPENTLLSITRAMEIGVDAVEVDVHLTRDNEIVVIHDETVDRTTNGAGPVAAYDLQAIQNLDAGKGQRIPALQEVMNLVRGKVRLVIELKGRGTEAPVTSLIRKNDFFRDSYVISFWHKMVQWVKKSDPRIKTGVLLVGCPVDVSIATRAGADALVMRYNFVDKGLVDMAHAQGLKVFVWNIDDRSLVAPYVTMGVDGIGTNDPRILVECLRT